MYKIYIHYISIAFCHHSSDGLAPIDAAVLTTHQIVLHNHTIN